MMPFFSADMLKGISWSFASMQNCFLFLFTRSLYWGIDRYYICAWVGYEENKICISLAQMWTSLLDVSFFLQSCLIYFSLWPGRVCQLMCDVGLLLLILIIHEEACDSPWVDASNPNHTCGSTWLQIPNNEQQTSTKSSCYLAVTWLTFSISNGFQELFICEIIVFMTCWQIALVLVLWNDIVTV